MQRLSYFIFRKIKVTSKKKRAVTFIHFIFFPSPISSPLKINRFSLSSLSKILFFSAHSFHVISGGAALSIILLNRFFLKKGDDVKDRKCSTLNVNVFSFGGTFRGRNFWKIFVFFVFVSIYFFLFIFFSKEVVPSVWAAPLRFILHFSRLMKPPHRFAAACGHVFFFLFASSVSYHGRITEFTTLWRMIIMIFKITSPLHNTYKSAHVESNIQLCSLFFWLRTGEKNPCRKIIFIIITRI